MKQLTTVLVVVTIATCLSAPAEVINANFDFGEITYQNQMEYSIAVAGEWGNPGSSDPSEHPAAHGGSYFSSTHSYSLEVDINTGDMSLTYNPRLFPSFACFDEPLIMPGSFVVPQVFGPDITIEYALTFDSFVITPKASNPTVETAYYDFFGNGQIPFSYSTILTGTLLINGTSYPIYADDTSILKSWDPEIFDFHISSQNDNIFLTLQCHGLAAGGFWPEGQVIFDDVIDNVPVAIGVHIGDYTFSIQGSTEPIPEPSLAVLLVAMLGSLISRTA